MKRTLSFFLLKRIYKTEELYLENLQRNVLAKEKEKNTSQNDLQDSDGTQEINFSLTYCQPDPCYHNLPHIQM